MIEIVGVLIMTIIVLIGTAYIVKTGECQNRAKYEGWYNDNTPFDCLEIKNLDIGTNRP